MKNLDEYINSLDNTTKEQQSMNHEVIPNKWYLLGCYQDYKLAVRTRQLIIRVVTNDDPRVIFDPRMEINDFLQRSVTTEIVRQKKVKHQDATMVSEGSLPTTDSRVLPSANDTAPLILGRVRRSTDDKLALLRVRRYVWNYRIII